MLIEIYGETSNVWGIVWMEVRLKVAAEHKGMENGVPRDRHSVQACNFRYRDSPSPAESPGSSQLRCGLEWKYNALLSFLWPYVLPSPIYCFPSPGGQRWVSCWYFFCNLLFLCIQLSLFPRSSIWNVNLNFIHSERRKILFNSTPEKYAFYRDPRTRWIFIRDTFLPTVDRATGDIYLPGGAAAGVSL